MFGEIDAAHRPVDGEIIALMQKLRPPADRRCHIQRRELGLSSGELEMISGVTASSINRLSASSTMTRNSPGTMKLRPVAGPFSSNELIIV